MRGRTRAADPQLRAMLTAYLDDAALSPGARVLEVGLWHGRDHALHGEPARGVRGGRGRPVAALSPT
jgi:hypothetical protein